MKVTWLTVRAGRHVETTVGNGLVLARCRITQQNFDEALAAGWTDSDYLRRAEALAFFAYADVD